MLEDKPYLVVSALAAAALAVAFATGPAPADSNLGYTVGRAIGIFLISGLIPAIWWGSRRFRPQSAANPLILWAVLQVLVSLGQFGLFSDDIAAARLHVFHPDGCDFSVSFPGLPREYTMEKADAEGKLWPLYGAELDLDAGSGFLRAECVVIDGLDPAALTDDWMSATSQMVGRDLGLQRIGVALRNGSCGRESKTTGLKESGNGRIYVEVVNVVGTRSILTLYTASLATDWKPEGVDEFVASLQCRVPSAS